MHKYGNKNINKSLGGFQIPINSPSVVKLFGQCCISSVYSVYKNVPFVSIILVLVCSFTKFPLVIFCSAPATYYIFAKRCRV